MKGLLPCFSLSTKIRPDQFPDVRSRLIDCLCTPRPYYATYVLLNCNHNLHNITHVPLYCFLTLSSNVMCVRVRAHAYVSKLACVRVRVCKCECVCHQRCQHGGQFFLLYSLFKLLSRLRVTTRAAMCRFRYNWTVLLYLEILLSCQKRSKEKMESKKKTQQLQSTKISYVQSGLARRGNKFREHHNRATSEVFTKTDCLSEQHNAAAPSYTLKWLEPYGGGPDRAKHWQTVIFVDWWSTMSNF